MIDMAKTIAFIQLCNSLNYTLSADTFRLLSEWNDKEILLKLINKNPQLYCDLPETLKMDEDIVDCLLDIECSVEPEYFNWLPQSLQSDYETVKFAVRCCGDNLKNIDRADFSEEKYESLVKIAIESYSLALRHAGQDMRNNERIVRFALDCSAGVKDIGALEVFQYASEELSIKIEEMALHAVNCEGENIKWINCPINYQLALDAVCNSEHDAWDYLREKGLFVNDKAFCLDALKKSGNILQHIPEDFLNDPFFLFEAIKGNLEIWGEFPDFFQKNLQFVSQFRDALKDESRLKQYSKVLHNSSKESKIFLFQNIEFSPQKYKIILNKNERFNKDVNLFMLIMTRLRNTSPLHNTSLILPKALWYIILDQMAGE